MRILLVLDTAFFEKWLKKRILKIAGNGVIIAAVLLFAREIAPRIVGMVCPMRIPHSVDKGHIAFALANMAVIGFSVLASVLVYLQARLHFKIEVEDALQAWRIPRMALQILVGNAILHGLSKKKGEGRISSQRNFRIHGRNGSYS